MSIRDWFSAKLIVRHFGVKWATFIITVSTFIIVSSIIFVAAIYTHFPVLPGLIVTILIHLILVPQTYQTHLAMAELDAAIAALYKKSITDELTRTYNRRYFMEELKKSTVLAKEEGIPFSLIQFDLDNFKRFNDTFGHQFGDHVLSVVSTVCKQNSRQNDVFARLGGEEFAFLLKDMDINEAVQFAERIRKIIHEMPLEINGALLKTSISVGVSTYQSHKTVDEILRMGDDAMYQAKANGKNCVAVAALQ
jgi:diguanylate cyclase (GGDEF)-like protein